MDHQKSPSATAHLHADFLILLTGGGLFPLDHFFLLFLFFFLVPFIAFLRVNTGVTFFFFYSVTCLLRYFIFLGSQITADGDCSHEIKRLLLLGRKAMTNLDSILKSRGITFLTNVRLVNAMVFLVVMYHCESWILKKAEH